jgi:hypothetical protein
MGRECRYSSGGVFLPAKVSFNAIKRGSGGDG